MIQLTRRGFLQLTFSAIAAATLAPLEKIVQQAIPVYSPKRLWLYDLTGRGGRESTFLSLARPNGNVILQIPMAGGVQNYYQWWTTPGHEIVIPAGEGLLNLSGDDVDLRVSVRDDNWHWVVNQKGQATALDPDAPALNVNLWVPQGDRYRLET